jgi:hypothetical protein
MRVYEAGHEHTMTRVEGRFVGERSPELSSRAHGDDFLIAHDDRAVFDDTKRAEGRSALGAACDGKKLGGGVDEHGKKENQRVVTRD